MNEFKFNGKPHFYMSHQSRQRILYYCQSLVGIGHLTASLQIIKALSRYYDVDLVYGGIHYTNFPDLPGFRRLQLAPLLLNESGELFSPDSPFTVDVIWQQREKQIRQFCNQRYQAAVFEFYPFGRRRFKNEIRSLIKSVHQHSGAIPLFSQIREILIPSDSATEQKIADEINTQFHTVLIRGDSRIIQLDETFSLAPQLSERLFYGGYVCEPEPPSQNQRQPTIIVSQGGGSVGRDLLTSAIKAAPLLPVYSFLIVTGSNTSASDMNYLQAFIKSNNVNVVPFLSDFRQRLSTAALSINMGGDNTIIDIVTTRAPCLAFPLPGNSEQALRIKKFAEHGWLTPLHCHELEPDLLAGKIQQALQIKLPQQGIDLNGANNICAKIREVLENKTL